MGRKTHDKVFEKDGLQALYFCGGCALVVLGMVMAIQTISRHANIPILPSVLKGIGIRDEIVPLLALFPVAQHHCE
jgi:hypothetical protein